MTEPGATPAQDAAAAERSAIATTGLVGALLGWCTVVAVYFLLRHHPALEGQPTYLWVAAGVIMSASTAWSFARVMRRHFERRRRLALKLAELMEKLGSTAEGEARAKIEAAIERIADEPTREFLRTHFQKKTTA